MLPRRQARLFQLEAQLATGLYSWARPDSVSISGGKITQCNAPAASALFNGNLCATTVQSTNHFYDSSIAATNWKFLHDGTGSWVWLVFAATNAALRGDYVSTRLAAGVAETGFLLGYAITANTARTFVQNGVGSAVDTSGVGTIANNSAAYLQFGYTEGASPEYDFRQRTTQIASGNSALAPSASDPDITLRLFRSGSNTPESTFADLLIYKGNPSATFKSLVQEYLGMRYAI